ncbi:hypothetical protein QEH57_04380 [Pelagicoccus sp. SDUM812005]|nr:hypothetical protein [Pelagicoccus sp. SDUM812005]
MSYQERNNWIELLVALWAIGYYGVTLLSVEGGLGADLSYFLPFLVKVIVVSIVLGIVLAILNRVLSKDANDAKDEMDKAIDMRGFRNAYWVMSGALMVVIFAGLANERMLEVEGAPQIATTNLLIHSIFMVAALSGLVQSATQVFYYRRGLL